jgi:hypothetical protein
MSVYTYTARTFTQVATLSPHVATLSFQLDMKTFILSSTFHSFHSSNSFNLTQTSLTFLVKL